VLGVVTFSCASRNQNGAILESHYDRPIRVACIGDSITFGYGLTNRQQCSYPARLAARLGDRWEVRNFGVNGATLLKKGTRSYWTQPAYDDARNFKPDVVVIMLGTNDTKRDDWEGHREEFVPDYLNLIRSFRKLDTKPRVYLCLPLPLFRDRGKEWDTDAVLKREVIPEIIMVARKAKLPIVDLYTAFDGKSGNLPDGVHPDATGDSIIADHLYSALTGQKSKSASEER
jgi:acyl-CoA thioesterase-1